MSIAGSLTDFSFPEICQFIEKGHKTGLLTFRASSATQTTPASVHYIWVRQGRIVAAANQLSHQGLVSLIEQGHWVSDRVLDKLVHWCCPINEPLGLYLKNQGVLQAKQLRKLFNVQVLQQVCAVFQLKDGQFQFDQNAPIPTRELTGLSISPTEAVLIGLRVLRNWGSLVDQLPAPNQSLVTTIAGQPPYRLNAQEWQVWEYTNGTVPLQAIAQQLRLPVVKVQQIAFRLSAIGLVTVHETTHRQLSNKLDSTEVKTSPANY